MVTLKMSRDQAEALLDAALARPDVWTNGHLEGAVEAIAYGCGMVKTEEQWRDWVDTAQSETKAVA